MKLPLTPREVQSIRADLISFFDQFPRSASALDEIHPDLLRNYNRLLEHHEALAEQIHHLETFAPPNAIGAHTMAALLEGVDELKERLDLALGEIADLTARLEKAEAR